MPELFDHHATSYEEDLAKALSASGEGREYFARGRVAWLERCLGKLGETPKHVLDFGCGDGFTTPMLVTALSASSGLGLDVSEKSLSVARTKYGAPGLSFELLGTYTPEAAIDLAYCNGVFHHIVPDERARATELVAGALRPGGLFSLWENNPWNPATHLVMSRCEFDADAQMLTPGRTRRMLRDAGFEIVRTDFRFIFPRALRMFRKLEDLIHRAPLGTQYQILARKRA